MKYFILLFLTIIMQNPLKGQESSEEANFYLTTISNIPELNNLYYNAGINFPVGKKKLFYFNTDLLVAKKEAHFSFYSENDYSYSYKRNAIGAGFGAHLNIVPKLYLNLGFNFYATHLKTELNTNNDFLTDILLPGSVQDNLSLSFIGQVNYEFTKKSAIFAKYYGNMQLEEVIHNSLLGIGYQYKLILNSKKD